MRMRKLYAAALAPLAVAAIAAGCGSDGATSSAATASAKAATAGADGATVLLTSAASIDTAKGSVTLPVFKGRGPGGEAVWYVVTDSSDRADAAARGVNYAPKLANPRVNLDQVDINKGNKQVAHGINAVLLPIAP